MMLGPKKTITPTPQAPQQPAAKETSAPAKSKSEIPESVCLGRPGDPVRAVYLHGLIPVGKDPKDFRDLERENRELLIQFAKVNRIRIAVPVTSFTSEGGNRRWQDSDSLAKIEAAAEKACGAKLAPQRCLMGFSRGGNWLNQQTTNCGQLKNYISTVSIGTNPKRWIPQRCDGKSKNVPNNHSMPSVNELSNLCGFNDDGARVPVSDLKVPKSER